MSGSSTRFAGSFQIALKNSYIQYFPKKFLSITIYVGPSISYKISNIFRLDHFETWILCRV